MAIFIAMAALILPQALAISSGIGGDGGLTYSNFPSTAGTTVNVKNTLSQNGLSGSGMATITGGGSLEEYYEWVSTNGLATAAAFAYLDDSDTYSYDFNGGRSTSTAWASLDFSATEADNFFLGGFAFNPNNYAGTFVAGDYAESINYKNYLYASSSKVSATESFYGRDFEDLEAYTWAERGFTDAEWKDVVDVADAYDYWDDGGSFDEDDMPEPGYYGAADGPANAIVSEQYMYLDDASILNPFKSYKAAASLYMNAATSSQSVSLNGADDEDWGADVEFGSWAQLGDWYDEDAGFEAYAWMEADGVTEKLNNVVYSSSSKATTLLATASQSASVYAADWIETEADSENYDDELDAYARLYIDTESEEDQYWDPEMDGGAGGWVYEEYESGIPSSLIETDSATAKKGSASVTQQITKASGAYLYKYVSADNEVYDSEDLDLDVEDELEIFGDIEMQHWDMADADDIYWDYISRIPEKASTLSGKSVATATLTSSSITGSWKANIAKDLTDYDAIDDWYWDEYGDDYREGQFFDCSFMRMGWAYNGDESTKGLLKTTKRAPAFFTFREADKANAFGVWT
ncbi:MAG: hypothetical protein WAW52_08140 [Methanothrix sp.]